MPYGRLESSDARTRWCCKLHQNRCKGSWWSSACSGWCACSGPSQKHATLAARWRLPWRGRSARRAGILQSMKHRYRQTLFGLQLASPRVAHWCAPRLSRCLRGFRSLMSKALRTHPGPQRLLSGLTGLWWQPLQRRQLGDCSSFRRKTCPTALEASLAWLIEAFRYCRASPRRPWQRFPSLIRRAWQMRLRDQPKRAFGAGPPPRQPQMFRSPR